MATATIEIPDLPTGVTLTASLVRKSNGALIESGKALTERAHPKTRYSYDHTDGASGWHVVEVYLESTAIGAWEVKLANVTGTYYAEDNPNPGNGVGPYSVTVEVVDPDGEPIEGARVRLSRSGQERFDITLADGIAELGCAAATWTVTIEAVGFTFDPVELEVSDDTEIEYELTADTVSIPATPSSCTGVLLTLVDGVATAGIVIYVRLQSGPGTAGYSYSSKWVAVVSGVGGAWEWTKFRRSSIYEAKRGLNGTIVEVSTPDAAQFNMPEILGEEP